MGAVDVKQTQEHEAMLEWDSSATNDMIADSCLALILGIDTSPASVKRKIRYLQLHERRCSSTSQLLPIVIRIHIRIPTQMPSKMI